SSGTIGTGTNGISVTPAPATQLVVTSAPSDLLTTNAVFDVQISAEDAFGNVDSNFSGAVTLTLSSNPSGAALGGTLTVTAANGFADFSDLTISKPGSGYKVQATSGSLTAATSPALGVEDQLAVTSQPPGTVTDSS